MCVWLGLRVSLRLTAGGAMWDSAGSDCSGVGCKVPEMMRMVSLSFITAPR